MHEIVVQDILHRMNWDGKKFKMLRWIGMLTYDGGGNDLKKVNRNRFIFFKFIYLKH